MPYQMNIPQRSEQIILSYAMEYKLPSVHGCIVGADGYITKPKRHSSKRRTLTQCIAGWLLKRYDAWLRGGAKVDWSKGKR